MELSKDTWHYRNFEIWRQRSNSMKHQELRWGKRQPDLCTYTRIVLIYAWFRRFGLFVERNRWFQNTLWFLVLYVVGIAVSVSFYDAIGFPDWSVFLLPFIVMPLAIGVLVALIVTTDKIRDWSNANHYDPSKDKEPNVVIEYVKAKKRKICPMVEFKEPF